MLLNTPAIHARRTVHRPVCWRIDRRHFLIFATSLLLGCGADDVPTQLETTHRESIRTNLRRLGAKVTADVPEGLYLSLRNTHIEIRELGGVIEGSRGTRNDIRDFYMVNEAITGCFANAEEVEEFKRWFRQSVMQRNSTIPRAEFGEITLTISRHPLRTIFSRKVLLAEKQ
jgi:hypothetical protein